MPSSSWFVALFVVAACSAPASTPAPLVNAGPPAASSRGPCDLGWIETADSLRVTERTDGHEGWFEFEIKLRRDGTTFAGTATGSYRQHEQQPPRRGTREIRVPSDRIETVLTALRTSFDYAPDAADSERVSVHESWHTVRLTLELFGAASTRFATNEGHVRPQPWRLDGCDRTLPSAGRAQFQEAYAELEQMIERQPLFDSLERRTVP